MYFSPMKSKTSSVCFNTLIKRKFYSLPKKNYEKLLSFESISKPRYYSEVSLDVFDRNSKRMHRDWSASLHGSHIYDYIKDEIGDRVADRVYDITRKFSTAVELGCGKGHITKHLTPESIEMIYQCDISSKMLEKTKVSEDIPTFKMIVDEEYLPFADSSIDLFISSLNFHWINDLPSVFEQIHRALKPDGVLIASMFGGDSLFELRSSLQLAETEREGGFSPHISPFARIRDIGDLLTRAGYTMLTIGNLFEDIAAVSSDFKLFKDTDEIKVNYPTMFELLEDLRGMGETNAAWNRKIRIQKDSLLAASAIYTGMYGNEDKTIPATFEIIYLIGWKPHDSQAKPAKRGSGKISMKSISNLEKDKTENTK